MSHELFLGDAGLHNGGGGSGDGDGCECISVSSSNSSREAGRSWDWKFGEEKQRKAMRVLSKNFKTKIWRGVLPGYNLQKHIYIIKQKVQYNNTIQYTTRQVIIGRHN